MCVAKNIGKTIEKHTFSISQEIEILNKNRNNQKTIKKRKCCEMERKNDHIGGTLSAPKCVQNEPKIDTQK